VVMLGYLAVRRPAALRATRIQLSTAAVSGILLLAGGNGLVTVAEQRVESGLVALIIACVFVGLQRRYWRPFLRHWTWSWLALAAYTALSTVMVGAHSSWHRPVSQSSSPPQGWHTAHAPGHEPPQSTAGSSPLATASSSAVSGSKRWSLQCMTARRIWTCAASACAPAFATCASSRRPRRKRRRRRKSASPPKRSAARSGSRPDPIRNISRCWSAPR